MDCCEGYARLVTSRRALLLGGASFAAWAYLPKFARAADGRDPRLIVVILRGALDGLATVAPVGDPDYAGLHGSIALASGGAHPALMLDSFFGLHPSMPEFARMYREQAGRGDPCGVDALSRPLAFRRAGRAGKRLCRARAGCSPAGSTARWKRCRAASASPARLRSARPRRWCCAAPRRRSAGRRWRCRNADDDTAMRLVELYRHRDPALATALSQGLQLEKAARRRRHEAEARRQCRHGDAPGGARRGQADGADDGPRIAALAFDGWDTHANEGGPVGRLAQLLSGLDGALAEFESGLGARWRDTAIVVATEFGRTARINGTDGTDHGTGTIALLAGGAIKGGRVISDWPGLKPANLYQGRDLAPTTDLRAVIKGVLARSPRPQRARAGGDGVSG